MEEKKLTDEEIIKALECCAMISVNPRTRGECTECPYFQNRIDCVSGKRSEIDTLDLIHRLQDENERLTEELNDTISMNEMYVEKVRENAELQKQVDELKEKSKEVNDLVKEKVKDTAKEIFEKIFEVLCCFTTQGKSKEYAEGYIDCLEEVDKRLQNLAKEKYGVEVE